MITVAKVEWSSDYMGTRLYQLQLYDNRWIWFWLGGGNARQVCGKNIHEAVTCFNGHGNVEIWVLDSLRELSDWIRDNS